MNPNAKLSLTQNDMKNVQRRMFDFQRAETVAQVHQYSSDIIKSNKRQISKSNISETAANFEK